MEMLCQCLVVAVLSLACVSDASLYGRYGYKPAPKRPSCNPPIPDPAKTLQLQGMPAPQAAYELKAAKSGRALCSSTSFVLQELVVDVELGTGYNKTSQREKCWVDADDNIQYVTCTTKDCNTCKIYGQVNKCVPVTTATSFRAICRPLAQNSSLADPKGSLNIRDLTVELPTCCQCQNFNCALWSRATN